MDQLNNIQGMLSYMSSSLEDFVNNQKLGNECLAFIANQLEDIKIAATEENKNKNISEIDIIIIDRCFNDLKYSSYERKLEAEEILRDYIFNK